MCGPGQKHAASEEPRIATNEVSENRTAMRVVLIYGWSKFTRERSRGVFPGRPNECFVWVCAMVRANCVHQGSLLKLVVCESDVLSAWIDVANIGVVS